MGKKPTRSDAVARVKMIGSKASGMLGSMEHKAIKLLGTYKTVSAA